MPDKLRDCNERDPALTRALHRRGRLAQAAPPRRGATARFQAILAALGQDAQRREGPRGQGLRQRQAQPRHHRARRRASGDEFDIDKAALPQDHHHGRCRCRRQPHPHAAADLLLPLHAPAHRAAAMSTPPCRRCIKLDARQDAARGLLRRGARHASPPRCAATTRTRRSTSAASRASARWTRTSCGRRPWTPRRARCKPHHARRRREGRRDLHHPHGRKGRAAQGSSSSKTPSTRSILTFKEVCSSNGTKRTINRRTFVYPEPEDHVRVRARPAR